jgi:hypothetical protein
MTLAADHTGMTANSTKQVKNKSPALSILPRFDAGSSGCHVSVDDIRVVRHSKTLLPSSQVSVAKFGHVLMRAERRSNVWSLTPTAGTSIPLPLASATEPNGPSLDLHRQWIAKGRPITLDIGRRRPLNRPLRSCNNPLVTQPRTPTWPNGPRYMAFYNTYVPSRQDKAQENPTRSSRLSTLNV